MLYYIINIFIYTQILLSLILFIKYFQKTSHYILRSSITVKSQIDPSCTLGGTHHAPLMVYIT